jgi:tRNA U34 5-carboxymethylaminomethyl modifying GTPase MnmE/TrmE
MNGSPAYIEDTIVAAATPPGKGGIGVVRLSVLGAGWFGNRCGHRFVFPRARFIYRRVRAGVAGPWWSDSNVTAG